MSAENLKSMAHDHSRNRRSFRNLLINPRFQWKYIAISALSGIALSAIYSYVFYSYVSENYAILVDLSPMTDDVKVQLYRELRQIIAILIGASLLFVTFTCALALVFSHRAAGPLFHFKRVFDEIRKGRQQARIALRPSDEFQDVATSFNSMMDQMQGTIEQSKTSK